MSVTSTSTSGAARSSPVYFLDRSATSSSSLRLPFLSRRARKASAPIATPPRDGNDTPPPPPPPKDNYYPPPSPTSPGSMWSARTAITHRPTRSADSEVAQYLDDFFPTPPSASRRPTPTRSETLPIDNVSVMNFPSPPPTPPKARRELPAPIMTTSTSSPQERPRPRASTTASLAVRSKSLPRISPEERARLRAEERARREEEEREFLRLELERQERVKAEKAAQLLEDEREDADRRRILNGQIRAAAFQRAMREREEAQQEELRRQAIAERKRLARLKRKEEAAQLERWRAELKSHEEEVARRAEETRKQLEQERAMRIRKAGDFEGWLGVQTEGVMHWRRRYAKLRGRHLSLYKSPPGEGDLGKPISIVPVTKAERVLEGPTAPEELEYISHALALELHAAGGNSSTLLLYADSADEKECFLAALRLRTDL